MIITLDDIKAEQLRLAYLIAKFEEKATTKTAILFPEQLIDLAPGEHYAGIITSKDGEASYHLILMAGEAEEINWDNAIKWAKEHGGDLPNRREQSLLFANLKDQFKDSYYWSGEQHASTSDYAWCQGFDDGGQNYDNRYGKLRARLVRRIVIE